MRGVTTTGILQGAVLLFVVVALSAGWAAQSPLAQKPVVPERKSGPNIGYETSFRFAGLPAPLEKIVAFARFEVSNRDCVPVDFSRAPGGVRVLPEFQMDLVLKATDSDYTATIYADALADTDMFGLGTCRWRLEGVTVNFKSETTLFVGGLPSEQMRDNVPVVQHYLVKDFFEKPKVGDWVFGEKPDYYLKSLGPQFTLTVTARKLP